jgi:hypothetical protein
VIFAFLHQQLARKGLMLSDGHDGKVVAKSSDVMAYVDGKLVRMTEEQAIEAGLEELDRQGVQVASRIDPRFRGQLEGERRKERNRQKRLRRERRR